MIFVADESVDFIIINGLLKKFSVIHDNILSLIQNIDGPSSNSYVFFAKHFPFNLLFSLSPFSFLSVLRSPFPVFRFSS